MHKPIIRRQKATLSWCAKALVVLLAATHQCPAQRIVQYHSLLPLINPSAMGEIKSVDVGIVGQYGLYGFDGAPQTVALSATVPFSVNLNANAGSYKRGRGTYQAEAVKNSYIGLSAIGSSVGVHQNISALVGYGHKVRLGAETYLTLAFTGGANVQSASYAKAANEYVTDPAILQRENSATLTAFAWQVGAYLHSNAYYLSLFTTSTSASEYCYQVGWRSQRERGWNVDLSTLGIFRPKNEQKKKYQQDLNLMLRYNEGLSVGVSYRTQKDVACMGAIKLGQLRLGYAYQIFNFDKLLPTHEVMIKYTLGDKKEKDDSY